MSKLKRYIEESGLTQREAAIKIGVSEEHLSRVINQKTKITAEFVGRFVEAFGPAAYQEVFGIAGGPGDLNLLLGIMAATPVDGEENSPPSSARDAPRPSR